VRPFLLALATMLIVTASTRPGRAQGADAALATELFNAGRDLMRDGNFAAACPKLAESARLDAKVGTFGRLAECEEKLGSMVAARGHWQQAVNLAQVQNDPRLAHVKAELARVDGVVSKVDVVLDGPTPQGLSLRLDDVEVGAGSLGLALPVDAGSHTIVVSAPGKNPFTTTVSTSANGAVISVHVPKLENLSAAPVPLAPTPVTVEPRAPASYWTPAHKAGASVLGVGAATLAIGTVFGILAKVKLDSSNSDGCVDNVCPGPGYEARNAARTDGTISTVLFIAGAAVAAGGVTMLVISPSKSEHPVQTMGFDLEPGGLVARGTF
jgi:hypothetical protein